MAIVGVDSRIDVLLYIIGVNIGVMPVDDLHEVGGLCAWKSSGALEGSSRCWE